MSDALSLNLAHKECLMPVIKILCTFVKTDRFLFGGEKFKATYTTHGIKISVVEIQIGFALQDLNMPLVYQMEAFYNLRVLRCLSPA